MAQVPTKPTPLTQAQALGTLLAAGCPQSALLMVAAQSAVETAAFGSTSGKGFNNYNFGNVTPSVSQIAAGAAWMDQGVHGMKYLSFDNPIDGAKAMLGWLQSHGLYTFAQNNDLSGYMAQLARGCYLGCIGRTDPTGHTVSQQDYDNYRAGIQTWMNKLASVTPSAPPSAPPAPGSEPPSSVPGGVIVGVLLAVAALGIWQVWKS